MPAFASARSLYANAGFRPCGPFGDYVPSRNSTFMTLSLNGSRGSGSLRAHRGPGQQQQGRRGRDERGFDQVGVDHAGPVGEGAECDRTGEDGAADGELRPS